MPPDDLIFRLIGDMLGASLPWAQGVVRVERASDQYSERFWQSRGEKWRIERSDGLIFTDHLAHESTTMLPGGPVERGPSTGLAFTASVQLLKPSKALIWGRPGEDWRLTSTVSATDRPGLWRVALQHTEDTSRVGFILVEEGLGILHELNRDGDGSFVLDAFEPVNVDRLDDHHLLR